jgi:hypothetical protein
MSSGGPTGNGMIESILSESKYIKINGLEVDIQKWSKMSSWTVMQAVCIFHGIDPVRGLQDKYLKPLSIYKNIMDAYDVMENAASDNKIPYKGDPALFIDWAELVGITVSEELKNAVLEEGNKRDMFELERHARGEETIANLEREKKSKQSEAEQLFLEQGLQEFVSEFIFTPKSTTYGYFPALEEVLEEACQAGEPIPSPEDTYDRMLAKKPKLVNFTIENRTLTYITLSGEKSRLVTLKAIGQAISARTDYR